MSIKKLETFFAPPERATEEVIARQYYDIANSAMVQDMLDAMPDIVIIINRERQIVFANASLKDFLGIMDEKCMLGSRPGELFDCVNADEMEAGCGTSEFCTTCGAVKAILSTHLGKRDVQDCRMLRNDGTALDLRVWTTPFELKGVFYTIFAVTDESDSIRRRILEKVFFHDVLNTAGGVRGFAEIVMDATSVEYKEYLKTIVELTDNLISEIQSQQMLAAAENRELSVFPASVKSMELLEYFVTLFKNHKVASERSIIIDKISRNFVFVSDRTILGRVIGNMVKNGLEASLCGDTVTIGCEPGDCEVRFWVHNNCYMPRDIQLQIFQRSFSTRGKGRGLGTYSMKLLGERYLKGKVSFTSSEANGTLFELRLPRVLEVTGAISH